MKTPSPFASRLLWTCAVAAILATASIIEAQSADSADAEGGAAADPATAGSAKTLDQVRQLPSVSPSFAVEYKDVLEGQFNTLNKVEFKEVIHPATINRRQALLDLRKMALKKVTELRTKLKASEDRAAVEPLLRTALAEYFLADMQHRVRELDEIKAKVAETEAKLQRRLDSQQESIDLQLKLFIAEADGLGLFRPEDSLERPTAENTGLGGGGAPLRPTAENTGLGGGGAPGSSFPPNPRVRARR